MARLKLFSSRSSADQTKADLMSPADIAKAEAQAWGLDESPDSAEAVPAALTPTKDDAVDDNAASADDLPVADISGVPSHALPGGTLPAGMVKLRAAVIAVALLIWLAVAFKAWQLRNRPAPVASRAPVSQVRTAPQTAPTPSAPRPLVRRAAPIKRRVANTNRRAKRTLRRVAPPKRSIILGRGAVLEDDKSIIRIRD